ncbi:MAG: lysophospholipid acyltransferase family protein [Nitrospira sp. BO4]|nr:lysophospholipid acyltransferase family protein [Nitrospira sp. BO4]
MSELIKSCERWLKCSLLPPVGAAAIRGVARSMRFETRGHEAVDALYQDGRHIILAFWHAQQLMIPIGYRGTGSHVLISRHGDGEIIARIIARFGHEAVRGSSTRGGVGALKALIKLGRSGRDVVVTPDGPKGPRHVAKLGVIHLAKATGLPIVPLAFACSKKNSLRAGIVTWSHIRSPEACFSTEVRSGSRAKPMRPHLKRLAWSSRRSSIA